MNIKEWSDKVIYGGMYISELEKLYEISKDQKVLEIGSMVGMSSGVIANIAKRLVCVDLWGKDDYEDIPDDHSKDHYLKWEEQIGDLEKTFIDNMEPYLHKTLMVKSASKDILPHFQNIDERFNVILIDGDHSYDGTLIDYINSVQLLFRNGLLCFHDHGHNEWPGVKEVCDFIDNYDNRLEFVEQVETLRIYRRK